MEGPVLVRRKYLPHHDVATDRRWRIQASCWFLLSIAVAIATPHLAQLWIENHWGHVSSTILRFTVDSWIEIYLFTGLATLVAFEIGHYQNLHGHKVDPPAFMEKMLTELAEKAGIPTPLLIYEPDDKPRAATSTSFLSGSKIYWQCGHERFTLDEIRAVLAHEVGHLVLMDTRTSLVKHLVLGGLRLLALVQFMVMLVALTLTFFHLFPWYVGNFVLVTIICYALLSRSEDAIFGGIAAGLLLYGLQLSIDITAPIVFAFTTSLAGTILSVVASHAYSRVTEYRADAVAIDLAGPEYADDLSSALDKFFKLIYNTEEKRQLYRSTSEWLMSHPRMVDRRLALRARQMKDLGRRSLAAFKLV
jgi:Zn-dependent protease with chaperone function